jgi:hypothetical protein
MPMPAEVKLVFRQLRKSPGFTLTAVLMLAFGIGATTAIFSIVDGVLLRPLPFPHAAQLVTLGDQVEGTDWAHTDPGPVTGPEVITYARDHSTQLFYCCRLTVYSEVLPPKWVLSG